MRQWMLLMALLVFLAVPVTADNGTAGQAAPVLRFGVGARSFAMGGAYGVIAGDDTATYWNPAGLAELKAPVISTMHSELFLGTTYDYLGGAVPLQYGGLGVSVLKLDTPGLVLTDGSIDDASTMAALIGYGFQWAGWNLGATIKYYEQNLPTSAGNGFGLDLGLQKQLTPNYRIGLTLQDLAGSEVNWDTGWTEAVPLNIRLGVSYTRERVLLVAEFEKAETFRQNHFGFELTATDFLKVRGGFRGNDFTAGIGLTKGQATVDYAYCGGELDNTHRLSFSYLFNKY
ncbi:MAG TPA: PorV/PorQ family protein [Bacillota bacterium]|nr:PorV/PorQ family protein [Bacillota bacterium]